MRFRKLRYSYKKDEQANSPKRKIEWPLAILCIILILMLLSMFILMYFDHSGGGGGTGQNLNQWYKSQRKYP